MSQAKSEGRPNCNRCVKRGDECTGYRDDADLIFRHETQKIENKLSSGGNTLRRRASDISTSGLSDLSSTTLVSFRSPSSQASKSSTLFSEKSFSAYADVFDASPLGHSSNPVSELASISSSIEDQATSEFFEKFVMYPCNLGSSPGFLEFLPGLFEEPHIETRTGLRWAVRAAAYANLAQEHGKPALKEKAVECYGLALSALSRSLTKKNQTVDDHILMAVVVLDFFETMYLGISPKLGGHAEGMKQILRLRGPSQPYDAKSWSLFQLAHHRIQKQQLAFRQEASPESKAWLEPLNMELPEAQIEKQNFEISRVCALARKLVSQIDNINLSAERILPIIEEIRSLDEIAVSWRSSPSWQFQTLKRSDMPRDARTATFPETIQLHRDGSTRTKLFSIRQASTAMIQLLADEVISTVPQSFGDINAQGMLQNSAQVARSSGLGGYFLLWSIKIIKVNEHVSHSTREYAKAVFERIRESTGMKSVLGDWSCI
ncbi:hypothetical protein BT63DRAFT_456896 [Microthyrium microscopicum]|uniref:Zn(2)-C6 fungal-type domain-containing protein n=1 Tax=Microthyrium microscopicum TaxID=703497 RepID=A0A6A6U9M8_9PEZI|nr:hypothetical protein BT63DRAFT_456896 [Microthyrium microscopicum]